MSEDPDRDRGSLVNTANAFMIVIERVVLSIVVLLTVGAIALKLREIVITQEIVIADILLLFLYSEVISMARAYFVRISNLYIYPILIAITALSRLIVLQGKEMDPSSILFESAAILILTVSILMLRSNRLQTFVSQLSKD